MARFITWVARVECSCVIVFTLIGKRGPSWCSPTHIGSALNTHVMLVMPTQGMAKIKGVISGTWWVEESVHQIYFSSDVSIFVDTETLNDRAFSFYTEGARQINARICLKRTHQRSWEFTILCPNLNPAVANSFVIAGTTETKEKWEVCGPANLRRTFASDSRYLERIWNVDTHLWDCILYIWGAQRVQEVQAATPRTWFSASLRKWMCTYE